MDGPGGGFDAERLWCRARRPAPTAVPICLWQNRGSIEELPLDLLRLSLLFALTAVAEIVGCYLPWLVVKQGRPLYLLIPAAASLALFAWLLTLHPSAAGRTYAAYGGMYIVVALLWLRFVDGVALTPWDVAGASIALVGMAVIALQPAAGV